MNYPEFVFPVSTPVLELAHMLCEDHWPERMHIRYGSEEAVISSAEERLRLAENLVEVFRRRMEEATEAWLGVWMNIHNGRPEA